MSCSTCCCGSKSTSKKLNKKGGSGGACDEKAPLTPPPATSGGSGSSVTGALPLTNIENNETALAAVRAANGANKSAANKKKSSK